MSQTLYFGGPIVTMERELYVQALLTEGERILYAGSLHGAEERAEGTVRRVDLKGRALLPAFVDAHSHLTAYANTFLQAGLGECAGWEELGRRLSAFAAREGLAPGEWVRGEGYDHNELAEGRHPARQLLDAACPGHPVMIQHRSGHVGVFNTLALERLGVNEETPCPPGGRMERGPDGKLTGYMEENAFLQLQKRVPLPDTEDLLAAYDKAQRSYASYGVATVQEGMMPDQLIPLDRQLLERDLLWLDVVGYADADGQAAEAFSGHIRAYSGHFKLGGYKIFLDGSPQGRTAWMRTPYLGGGPQDRGYPVLTDRQVYDRMALALDQGMQLLAHCNGDAAAGQYLSVLEQLEREREAHLERPVMIHAQLLDLDQLDKVKELGVVPSFFAAHVYHWGDVHVKNFDIRVQIEHPVQFTGQQLCRQKAVVHGPGVVPHHRCVREQAVRDLQRVQLAVVGPAQLGKLLHLCPGQPLFDHIDMKFLPWIIEKQGAQQHPQRSQVILIQCHQQIHTFLLFRRLPGSGYRTGIRPRYFPSFPF